MKKQRGQVIIEFALILPLFLLMIFGLIYSGMLFYDYSTLSNVARSAAREAAITQTVTENDSTITGHYYNASTKKFHGGLITSLYVPKQSDGFKIHLGDQNDPTKKDDIEVIIAMQLNTSLPWIEIVLPQEFTIRYHMRKDVKS